jgi:succinyl-CoA synthetase beta subunit
MKLLEFEAKQILHQADISVPDSYIASNEPVFLPAVIKSQVPTGGRGKAGGIVVVQTEDEYSAAVRTIANLPIKGFTPRTLLAEQLLDISRELYLSIMIDKSTAQVSMMANKNGGVEIESQDGFQSWELGDGNWEKVGQELADYFDLPEQTFTLQDLIENLYKCFISNDALILEINPLVVTTDGQVIAGDCKMELDDAAIFRHPDWEFESEKSETNFVTLDPNGTVATVANGAGLAMATVDAVADAGLVPANFLDIGGGANEASILAAFKRLAEYPNVRVIIINIFAGITRCDEVARAIIAARSQIDKLPPLAVRLAGTNYEQAVELLAEQNIAIQPSLAKAIETAKEAV